MSILVFRGAAVVQATEVANAQLAAHAPARVATRILSVDKALVAPDGWSLLEYSASVTANHLPAMRVTTALLQCALREGIGP